MSIFDLIVEATPTEKDDELLATLKDLCVRYPFLKDLVLDILFSAISKKDT